MDLVNLYKIVKMRIMAFRPPIVYFMRDLGCERCLVLNTHGKTKFQHSVFSLHYVQHMFIQLADFRSMSETGQVLVYLSNR